MYPAVHARTHPDKPAIVMAGSGETISYAELDRRSTQLAHLWRSHGLAPGDHVAIFSHNQARYFEVMWAALRSGLFVTTINSYLSAEEVGYILDDSGARSMVTTNDRADVCAAALDHAPGVDLALLIGEADDRFLPYVESVEAMSADAPTDEPAGEMMLYSSGTTGRPKGIKRPLSGRPISEGLAISALVGGVFGMDADTVYLSPAPLYHSAPIGFNLGIQALGGTSIVMEKFDAADALRCIEKHRATHSQWVPTMFVRMLKLPEEERTAFDLSSMQIAVHAAAPCPVEVKKQMMDWWGPVLWEYYAGTELNGFCLVKPEEWLARPGTVGRAMVGAVHILDEAGNEHPPGREGVIYFGDGGTYEYHNDPEKTEGAKDPQGRGWTTLGDVGYLDEDGWLFLTDRKAFMIISGGVNIYPQEIEDCLIMHPDVGDVAVFGIPDEEMGESVMAAVQTVPGVDGGPELEADLRRFAREHIAGYKCPKRFEFLDELPRLPTGKLYKRQLRDRYWAGHESRI